MEGTGNYGKLLVFLLYELGLKMVVENPLKLKNFACAMMSVTKIDTIDARMPFLSSECIQTVIYKVPSKALLLLKQKCTVLRQFKKQIVMNKNLLGSIRGFAVYRFYSKEGYEWSHIIFREKSRT